MEHFICYPKNLENFTNKTRSLVKNKITSTNSINVKQYQFDTCPTSAPLDLPEKDSFYHCRELAWPACQALGSGSDDGGKATAQAWEKACGAVAADAAAAEYCKSRCPLAVALAAKTSKFCDKSIAAAGPEWGSGLYHNIPCGAIIGAGDPCDPKRPKTSINDDPIKESERLIHFTKGGKDWSLVICCDCEREAVKATWDNDFKDYAANQALEYCGAVMPNRDFNFTKCVDD